MAAGRSTCDGKHTSKENPQNRSKEIKVCFKGSVYICSEKLLRIMLEKRNDKID